MDIVDLVAVIVPMLVLVLVLRFAMSNRLGGEPRRSPLRRKVVTPSAPPSGDPANPFANDAPLATDPYLASIQKNSRHIGGGGYGINGR